jgi:hypothetical protein
MFAPDVLFKDPKDPLIGQESDKPPPIAIADEEE